MRNRSLLLLVVSLLSVMLLLSCLSGCKKADVYGAASDFIKVSHPKTPNVNSFSDESADVVTSSGSSSTSSDNTTSEVEQGTDVTDNNTSDGGIGSNSSTKEKTPDESTPEDDNGVFIVDNRGRDDMTPVIAEPNPNL